MACKRSVGQKVRKLQSMSGCMLTVSSEAWRYSGPFTRWNRYKRAFPGLGIAIVAFSGYVVFEALFLKDSHAHGEGHGEGHH